MFVMRERISNLIVSTREPIEPLTISDPDEWMP